MITIGVSWVSFNNDPYEREKDGKYRERNGEKTRGPTLEFLFNPASAVAGRVKKHYLLVRRSRFPEHGERRVDPRESDVVNALKAELEQQNHHPEVKIEWWDTDAPPTDHRELFVFTARALAKIRRDNPSAELVVNLSPGTPAAQTVMLVALQAQLAGNNVRAFQVTPPDKRRSPDDVVREVPWNLLAELAATPTEIDGASTRPAAWSLEHARSRRLREVATLVSQYGGVPFPVLIIGARGTGKTEVAERLRRGFRESVVRSPADSEWHFKLNCAEFRGDANMLRSALFGHKKGAHSQALKDEAGLFERAADDCVFLDEIHWMDPQAQGLLLVALQRNGSFRRLGGEKSIPAKFRLVAATNQPRIALREKLTSDFLDRISDLVIELPELRDCRDDLGEMWRSVVWRACEELVSRAPARAIGRGADSEYSERVKGLCEEFKPHHARIERAISEMRLAGNFRDLEKLARRLLVGGLAQGRYLSLKEELVREELDRLRRDERFDAEQGTGPATTLVDELPTIARCEDYLREMRDTGRVLPGPAAVDEWERRLLSAASAVGGSGAKGADLLGMNDRTFNAKMQKLNAASTKGKGG
jgi:transcriptional regulator with AAA-type ATPase domain